MVISSRGGGVQTRKSEISSFTVPFSFFNGGKFCVNSHIELKKPSTSGAICRLTLPFKLAHLFQPHFPTHPVCFFHGRKGKHFFWVTRQLGHRLTPTQLVQQHAGVVSGGQHGGQRERRDHTNCSHTTTATNNNNNNSNRTSTDCRSTRKYRWRSSRKC